MDAIECLPETECKLASSCDRYNAKCPDAVFKPNGKSISYIESVI